MESWSVRCAVWDKFAVDEEALVRALRPVKASVVRCGTSGLEAVDCQNLKVFLEGPASTRRYPHLERHVRAALRSLGCRFERHVTGPNRLVFSLVGNLEIEKDDRRAAIVRVETDSGVLTRILVPDPSCSMEVQAKVDEALARHRAFYGISTVGPHEWAVESEE